MKNMRFHGILRKNEGIINYVSKKNSENCTKYFLDFVGHYNDCIADDFHSSQIFECKGI